MANEQPRWRRTRRTLAVTGTIALLAGFVWLWWLGVPALYQSAGGGPDVENARLSAVTTTRAALLAGFVGLGALGTFWLNSRVYRITARTFELTERGHLTDRYAKAIEQLGDDKLDVRLGGIYSLEQIAHDSPRDRDQATIVEVLSAFVRVHSDPLYQYEATLPKDAPSEPAAEQRRKAVEYVAELDRPPVDVQAAVTVLGRLPLRAGTQPTADLSGAWLSKVDLTRANLTMADLSGADLTRARLSGANLTKADLSGANLTEARLASANLTEARLTATTLTKAFLRGANLTGADVRRADLTGADVRGANLPRAGLLEANLTGADLGGTNLTMADLSGADLTRARLSGTNLTEARLNWANLTKAVLSGADLTGADLSEANLTGANLSGAKHMTQEQVDETHGDAGTTSPAGLSRPEQWVSQDRVAPLDEESTEPR
jgi:uncharacterized protein YjbI with pentapeptide repeats